MPRDSWSGVTLERYVLLLSSGGIDSFFGMVWFVHVCTHHHFVDISGLIDGVCWFSARVLSPNGCRWLRMAAGRNQKGRGKLVR